MVQETCGEGGGPRAGPPVVRQPGHHEVVERPLAQRGLRLLCPVPGGGLCRPRHETQVRRFL